MGARYAHDSATRSIQVLSSRTGYKPGRANFPLPINFILSSIYVHIHKYMHTYECGSVHVPTYIKIRVRIIVDTRTYYVKL